MAWRKRSDDAAIAEMRAEIAALREQVTAHIDRLDEAQRHASAAADRIQSVESGVERLGAELSRQLHELGDDIEKMSAGTSDGAVVARLEELRATQVRLANEQARYEIAFREDLAALAEMLRRR